MSELLEITNDVRELLCAGRLLSEEAVRYVDGNPFAIVPTGYTLQPLDYMCQTPARARGTTSLGDERSFIAQVKRLGDATTVIYAEPVQRVDIPPKLTAVLNDHLNGASPYWRDHRAVFQPRMSHEWATWTTASGKQRTQADFAAFVEDNLPDIAMPPAGQMLEIALSIEAKKKVNFASGVRLQNGTQQLTYEETVEGTAAKGQLAIPDTISLGIPVLLNGSRYRVDARLRYRIESARLLLWVELIRPHDILQHAIGEMTKRIADETGFPLLVGSPD